MNNLIFTRYSSATTTDSNSPNSPFFKKSNKELDFCDASDNSLFHHNTLETLDMMKEELPPKRKRGNTIDISQNQFTLWQELEELNKNLSKNTNIINQDKSSVIKLINEILKDVINNPITPEFHINNKNKLVITIPIISSCKSFDNTQKSNFKYACSQFKEICELSENTFSIEYV